MDRPGWLTAASVVLVTLLSGCVSISDPPFDVDFGRVESLHDLAGLYTNEGDIDRDSRGKQQLSRIIWPDDTSLNHDDCDFIEVRAIDDATLEIRARREGTGLKLSRFRKGEDFDFDDGRLVLRRGPRTYPSRGAGLFLGLTYESLTIGLDERGHGKFRRDEGGAGLAYFLVPMVGYGHLDARFRRIAE